MQDDILAINNADIDNALIKAVLAIDRSKISKRLYIVLDTYGGYPDDAYRAMQHLHNLYTEIIAIVPNKAMSAGTLMCLGADSIYMFEGSSLGPLDLQVPHPTDGGQISTLDIKEANYDIFALTATVTKQLFEQNHYKLKIGKNQSAKLAHDAAVTLLRPLVSKIDPYHLHASFRNAGIGEKYGRILLLNRMMKGNVTQASNTSRILANDYNMHSYAITMDEASAYLSLNVLNIIDLPEYNDVQLIMNMINDGAVLYIPGTDLPNLLGKSPQPEVKKAKKEGKDESVQQDEQKA